MSYQGVWGLTIYFYHVIMYDVLVYAVVTTLKKNKSQAWCGWWESNPQNTGFEPVVYANSTTSTEVPSGLFTRQKG